MSLSVQSLTVIQHRSAESFSILYMLIYIDECLAQLAALPLLSHMFVSRGFSQHHCPLSPLETDYASAKVGATDEE